MRVGSVCSGIAAPETAWRGLPLVPAWFAEIDPFPSAVLAHRYPDVPNHGDFTALLKPENRPADVDVLVGGTPCQAFSVAGLRGGLTDPRGNLALAFVALVDVLRPRWVLWENVPGVLSSGGGRDFGAFLGALGHIGYGFAYRVLDAQYFGLAQRRKRVFVVASPGDWTGPAAVLLEPEGVRWDSPPRRRSRAGVAGSLGTGASCGGGWRVGADEAAGHVVAGARVPDGGGVDLESPEGVPDGGGDGEPVAFNVRGRDGGAQAEVDPSGMANLRAASGGSSRTMVAYQCHGSNVGEMGTLRSGNQGVTGGVPFIAVQESEYGTMLSDTAGSLRADRESGGTYALDTTRPGRGGGQAVMAYGGNNPDALDVATACNAKGGAGRMDFESETFIAHTLRAEGHDASEDRTGRGVPLVPVAMAVQEDNQNGVTVRDVAGSLRSDAPGSQVGGTLAMERYGVRRLTPREMERLQGFPDCWTLLPVALRKPIEDEYAAYLATMRPDLTREELERLSKDGPRAKALGNSMAVPVLRWLGERIVLIDAARTQSSR